MKCTQCGYQVQTDRKHCPACGSDLIDGPSQTEVPEQVVFQTQGGKCPKPIKKSVIVSFTCMAAVFGFQIIFLIATSFLPDEKQNYPLMLLFLMFLITLIRYIPSFIQVNTIKRFNKGELIISTKAIEGIASEKNPDGFVSYTNPMPRRILLQDVDSAGTDEDHAYLIVKCNDNEYLFATPEAQKAGFTIMDLIRSQI